MKSIIQLLEEKYSLQILGVVLSTEPDDDENRMADFITGEHSPRKVSLELSFNLLFDGEDFYGAGLSPYKHFPVIQYLNQEGFINIEEMLGDIKAYHKDSIGKVVFDINGITTTVVPESDNCWTRNEFISKAQALGFNPDYLLGEGSVVDDQLNTVFLYDKRNWCIGWALKDTLCHLLNNK